MGCIFFQFILRRLETYSIDGFFIAGFVGIPPPLSLDAVQVPLLILRRIIGISGIGYCCLPFATATGFLGILTRPPLLGIGTRRPLLGLKIIINKLDEY